MKNRHLLLRAYWIAGLEDNHQRDHRTNKNTANGLDDDRVHGFVASLCQGNVNVGVYGALLAENLSSRCPDDLVIAQDFLTARVTDYETLAHVPNRL